MFHLTRGHLGQSLVSVSTLLLLVGACSSHTPEAHSSTATRNAGNASSVKTTSASAADARSLRLAVPPGVDPERLAPRSPDDPRARLALDAAIALLAPEEVLPARRSAAPPSDEVLRETTRLYLAAREMSIDGRFFDSIRSLEQALKLDPGAIACMRLMADNYLSTIGPARALRLYEDILALDPDDLESLLRLGSAAWQRRDVAKAAGLLGKAHQLVAADGASGTDQDIRILTAHELGQVLLAEGCDEAGVGVWHELLERLADMPPESARFQREIDRLYRVAPEMWRDLGDAYCRLQRYEQAVQVYAQAFAAARVSDEDMLPRLIWALTQAGRTQDAINVLLEAIDDPEQVGAVELVGLFRDTDQSEALAAALSERLVEHPGELRYVQAIAALLPADRSDAIILDFLGEHGAESRVLRDLLPWAVDRLEPVQPIRLIVTLAEQSGQVPDELVDELIALTNDAERYILAWDELPDAMKRSEAGRLVRVSLLLRAFRYGQARQMLEEILVTHPDSTGALVRLTNLLVVLNLTDQATDTLARVTSRADDPIEFSYTRALLLAQLGRVNEAIELLDALQTSRPNDLNVVEHLRREAKLLSGAGRNEEAAAVLTEALAQDPRDAATYGALLRLYGFGGALQDGARFGDLARALFNTAPESRTFRMLRAEQDAGRGRFDDAISIYQALLAEDITDQAALDGLGKAWIAAGRAAEAVSWFAAKRVTRPGDRRLRDATFRALVADQRAGEVIDALRAAIAEHPLDFDSYRHLEEALKSVGREQEARGVVRDRWNQQPPSVAQSLALASLEIEENQAELALTHLREALNRASDHLDRHLETITLLASRIDAEGLRVQALELIVEIGRSVIDKRVEAAPSVFIAYVNAVAELDRPLDAVVEAIEQVRDLQPMIELEVTALATITLARHERIDEACQLCDRWLGVDRPFDQREANLIQWRLAQGVFRDEPDRVINLVRRAHETDLYQSIGLLSARPNAGDARFLPLAESLYRLSGEFAIQGHERSHDRLLEEALAVDPDHAMANNDLGYSLADRNERLDEAERMLVKAIKAAPSDSAVLDSLGWVRYKLGKLENPDGEPREIFEDAAIPLLEEAALLRKRDGRSLLDDDPVILDHLGDAYWRAGRAEDAINVWQRAVRAYDEQLQMTMAAVGDQDGIAAVEYFKKYYGEVVEGARAKAAAAQTGEQPAVAASPALDKNQP